MKAVIDRMKGMLDDNQCDHYRISRILDKLLALYPTDDHNDKVTTNYNLFRLVAKGQDIVDCSALVHGYFNWDIYRNSSSFYIYDYIYPVVWNFCNFSDEQVFDLIHRFPVVSELYQGTDPTIGSLRALVS